MWYIMIMLAIMMLIGSLCLLIKEIRRSKNDICDKSNKQSKSGEYPDDDWWN